MRDRRRLKEKLNKYTSPWTEQTTRRIMERTNKSKKKEKWQERILWQTKEFNKHHYLNNCLSSASVIEQSFNLSSSPPPDFVCAQPAGWTHTKKCSPSPDKMRTNSKANSILYLLFIIGTQLADWASLCLHVFTLQKQAPWVKQLSFFFAWTPAHLFSTHRYTLSTVSTPLLPLSPAGTA